jgi:hypothetical protein
MGDSFWRSGRSGVRQIFLVRKAITPLHSTVEARLIRFVGLSSVSTSGDGRRTGAAKPRAIRFAEISAFSGVQ